VSSVTHYNLDLFKQKALEIVKTAPYYPLISKAGKKKVVKLDLENLQDVEVKRLAPHKFALGGVKILSKYEKTNFATDEGMMSFIAYLQTLGVDSLLEKLGVVDGDSVTIGDFEMEYYI
jgi:GTP-binding protein